MSEILDRFSDSIMRANKEKKSIRFIGGDSKKFFGYDIIGDEFKTSDYSGVVDYDPKELIITAKCGTKISEIMSLLKQHNQFLPFDPPIFSSESTLGGIISSGFSGPSRAYYGSVKDFVLGNKIMNNSGEILNFGGRVMKNVAGFDVSRLMVGSFGTLGLILETSLKVLPKPNNEITLIFEKNEKDSIQFFNKIAGSPLPMTATFYHENKCFLRFSGSDNSIKSVKKELGGEIFSDNDIWDQIRDMKYVFFNQDSTLWKVDTLPYAESLGESNTLIEWNGARRWFFSDKNEKDVWDFFKNASIQATNFKPKNSPNLSIQNLNTISMSLNKKIKNTLDPNNIFGKSRVFKEF